MALRADASRMLLGYVWWVLEPLLYVAVFFLVFDVILESGRADFLMFLICGKLPFMWFSGSVNTSANSILAARGLVGQTRLPSIIFPLAKVQEGLYRQSAVFALLLAFVALKGAAPGLVWLWLLPIMLVQYLVILPCAVLGAVLVCVATDFTRLIQLGTVFLMFASGIFWDVRAVESELMQDALLFWNPIAFLLDAYRQVLMYGLAPDSSHLLSLGVLSVILCGVLFFLMAKIEQWLALRVLSL